MKAYPPETRQRAADLAAQGLSPHRVAIVLGVPESTVYRWLRPEKAERDRQFARKLKESYRGVCETCGKRTTGCKGPNAPRFCAACIPAQREPTKWPDDKIIAAIQWYADTYGEPPSVMDWSPTLLRARGHADLLRRAEKLIADGQIPWFTTVVGRFGSWNAGLRAAGFEPRAPHGGDGNAQRKHRARAAA